MVWESLGDTAQCNRLLQLAADRDPANMMVVERVLHVHRQTGNYHALVHLLERMTEAVRGLLHEQPELKPQLMAAHEELAGIYADGAYANPERAARHWMAISELDPQNVYAIYSARELFKQQGRFAQAIPLFAREQAVITDADRKLALYRDEAEVRRNAGDLASATEPLRQAYRLKSDDPAVTYEFGLSVVERIDAGQNVAPDERQEAARALVGLAEMYDGEHGMTYAQAALRAEPAQDRAMQLADYYAEQLGRQGELVEQYQAYLEGNPSGYCADKARAVLSGMGAPMAGQRHPSSPAIAGGRQPSHQSVPLPSSQPQAYAQPQQAYAPPQQEYAPPPQQPVYAPPVDQITSLLQQANEAVHQGRKPQAYELYRQVLEQEPTHPEALGWVEDFLRQRRKFAELRDVLLAAARAPGVSAETRLAQLRDVATLSETKLRDFDAAVSAWKQIYQIDRGDEQARKQLFALLEKLKRWDELAPLLEQQAMNEDDDEAKIALEKRLAQVHERERRDPAAAAEVWVRIAQLSPGDLDPIFTAVDLYEKVEQYPDAATVISEQLPQAQTDDQRAQLHTRLGDLRIKLADPGGAADAYAEAGELLSRDESWEKAANLYLESHRWADAAHILEKRARLCDGPDKAKLLAQAADALLSAGDPETALVNLESAAELDPIDDALAARVEELHQHSGRHGDHVAFLLRRADRLDDKQKRVEVRHRAAGIQRGLEDEEGARDTLQMV
ncbi:MAG TPA: hypothetical protein VFB62_20125, partial [Polyangiaceae bacterium]|nr:hypothetical protein [Polyangiaceae bacterium]